MARRGRGEEGEGREVVSPEPLEIPLAPFKAKTTF